MAPTERRPALGARKERRPHPASPEVSAGRSARPWLQLGYCVGKGEQAIRIIAPMPIKQRDRATGEQTGQTITLFKGVSVFDAQQVQPLPSGQPTPSVSDGRAETTAFT